MTGFLFTQVCPYLDAFFSRPCLPPRLVILLPSRTLRRRIGRTLFSLNLGIKGSVCGIAFFSSAHTGF